MARFYHEMTESELVEMMAEARMEMLRCGRKPIPLKDFTDEECRMLADNIYESWKAGDTSTEGDWFMVHMDNSAQSLCQARLNRSIEL